MSRAEPVVVVGGGIIGLAVAFELQERGRRVSLLERERIGGGATGAAGGMLAAVSEAEHEDPRLLALARDSLARYPEFVARVERTSGLTCGYRDEGTLWVAACRDDLLALEHLGVTLRGKGLAAERLDARALAALEPRLSSRVLGGLYAREDPQVDPRALAAGLARALRARGGTIEEGLAVRRIESVGGGRQRVTGSAADGSAFEREAEVVVLAAGAASTREIELDVGPFGLRPVKGQLLRLCGPELLRHVVRAPEVYLIPRRGGELLVGATQEELGYDLTPTAGAALDLLRRAFELLPGIYELAFREIAVGLRSAVEDHLPVIGPTEAGGLFLAFGHYRNGILLAPATAHYLASWIDEGAPPAALAPFLPARLAAARSVHGR